LGTGSDLQLKHDGSDSWIRDAGTGRLLIDGSEIHIRKYGAAATMAKFIEDGAVELYHNNARKLTTYSGGVEITGTLWIPDGSASGNRISLGNSGDLLIYHDGNNSFIKDTGTGRLTISTSQLQLSNAADSEVMIRATQDSGVELFFNGVSKLETRVGDTIFHDDIRIQDNNKINIGTGDDFTIHHNGTRTYAVNSTGNLEFQTGSNSFDFKGDGFTIKNGADNETMLTATANTGVDLYHNNVRKFQTISTGIRAIGTGGSPAEVRIGAEGTGAAYLYLDASNGDFGGGDYAYLAMPDGTSGQKLTLANMQSGGIAFNVGAGSGGAGECAKFRNNGDLGVGADAMGGSISSSHFGSYMGYSGWMGNSRNVNGNSGVMQNYGNQGEHRVLGDGDVQNTNNSYGQISDQTLKQDIVDAASQWNDIKQVKVRKFRFKDRPSAPLQIGVVAQEIETISPGLVKEQFENGTDGKQIKIVKYSILYMKAIKALQEAQTRIETLEAKVSALESS
jgi:hypothetical protein